MEIMDRLAACGIIPVVVLENSADALPTARAMVKGGIDVMEITFRTAAAAQSIKEVSENCPEMLVGAGTVITVEQCREAIDMGAKFIVSPGFDAELVSFCLEQGVPVVPGCVTPSEIMAAMKLGLKVLKFFPANVYGGLSALKALSAPFRGVRFIPTGGVNAANLAEFMASPCVFAVGGSWVCAAKDIAAGNFDKITALCAEARAIALGYEVGHVGINCADRECASGVAAAFNAAFGFPTKEGNSSFFASSGIEIMKTAYLGENGHLAVRTNRLDMAIADMEKRGYAVDMSTAKYSGGKMTAVYIKDEIGGFAVHLLQK